MSAPPALVASNLRLIGGNGINGIVDITVTKWRFTFHGCRWYQQSDREWLGFPCDCGNFDRDNDARQFQQMALTAIRDLAQKQLQEAPAQQAN